VQSIHQAFFRYGWLLPAWLPLAQVGGRALFNVLAGVYFLWGLAALIRTPVVVSRSILLLYVLLLLSMTAGALDAQDSERALRKLMAFFSHTMAFFFTLMVLQSSTQRMSEFMKIFAIAACLLIAVLYLQLGYLVSQETFIPELQLREDNLPFLVPILCFVICHSGSSVAIRRFATVLVLGLVTFYVLASGGRAALFGLLVAASVYLLTVLRRRWHEIVGVAMLAGVLAFALGGERLLRQSPPGLPDASSGWAQRLDQFTSHRLSLWRQALQHGPANRWLGVGMGNARDTEQIMETAPGQHVRHLHNFVLDAWYETGLIGVALLLGLLAVLFAAGWAAYRRLPRGEGVHAGVLLSSAAAIVAAALFSFSYGSNPFSLYLFVLLAALYTLYQRSKPAGSPVSR
jgi:teichuronic acid biosynthesis protein TuaE